MSLFKAANIFSSHIEVCIASANCCCVVELFWMMIPDRCRTLSKRPRRAYIVGNRRDELDLMTESVQCVTLWSHR